MITITTALLARLLAAVALTATLLALLTMWVLLRDPAGAALAVQREGLTGLAGLVAHSIWQRVSAR